MDMNELLNQLANNPQMAAQFMQYLQQNGGNVRPPMNWNMPTNPMAAMWMNNLASMMNNANSSQNAQNQTTNQQPTTQSKQTENTVSAVRVIKGPSEIKPDEILMNGNISMFLQDDLEVVYGKRWTNDGIIENMRFVRSDDESKKHAVVADVNASDDFNKDDIINEIANLIDGKLSQFVKDYGLDKRTPATKATTKKGVNENGN